MEAEQVRTLLGEVRYLTEQQLPRKIRLLNPTAPVPLREINHISVKKYTDKWYQLKYLEELGAVKYDGHTSKTQLKKMKIDLSEVGFWDSFYRCKLSKKFVKQYGEM